MQANSHTPKALENKKIKGGGNIGDSVVQHLPSKHKALDLVLGSRGYRVGGKPDTHTTWTTKFTYTKLKKQTNLL